MCLPGEYDYFVNSIHRNIRKGEEKWEGFRCDRGKNYATLGPGVASVRKEEGWGGRGRYESEEEEV